MVTDRKPGVVVGLRETKLKESASLKEPEFKLNEEMRGCREPELEYGESGVSMPSSDLHREGLVLIGEI